MPSETLTCVQCHQEFEFTQHEQEQAEKMGFDPPARCPECRRKKSKLAADGHDGRHRGKKREYHNKYNI